ncbi:hypothetical protein KRR39_19400 [Nocardioides panacis]|uniref:Uncharacterized protein n=1 Tax=Nocardioides panacis TaxID=2849501 RepID=A0A975SXF0_9ACTN|nr:T3SS effector HopA1 family protein [Nocardioides panacis]QWZ07572.1 hypothetical protein KRR39_19400 [Nocardioides panacis]
MFHRHFEELDDAVRTARRAVTTLHLVDPDGLGRVLHDRWYLGLASAQGARPEARAWQAWGPLWTADLAGPRGPGLVRLHLSVDPRTALHAVGAVTHRAQGWEHPWQLTSTALGGDLPAPESTVLLLPTASLLPLRAEVVALVEDLRPFLAVGVPALTLPIGRGAALSENPADGRTFGENRCRLVAEAVIGSMRVHHRAQVDRAIARFAAAGVDPERPYLEQRTTWDRPWRAA